MTLPLIAFLVAAIIPIFFGKIRSAPFWLTAQAAALAWNVAQHGDPSLHTYVALAEVLVVRALIAPKLLRRAIRQRGEPNLDLMPSNLFTWAIAIALVVLAFEFAAPAMSDDDHDMRTRHMCASAAIAMADQSASWTSVVACLPKRRK